MASYDDDASEGWRLLMQEGWSVGVVVVKCVSNQPECSEERRVCVRTHARGVVRVCACMLMIAHV